LAHEGTVLSLGLSPDGLTFATGGADQKIRIWDTASGTLLDVLSGHNGAVKSLVFRRDGKVLVSGGNDRRINVWQLIAKP
jgi:WD40 repeat protein